jgi:hypothetical protein
MASQTEDSVNPMILTPECSPRSVTDVHRRKGVNSRPESHEIREVRWATFIESKVVVSNKTPSVSKETPALTVRLLEDVHDVAPGTGIVRGALDPRVVRLESVAERLHGAPHRPSSVPPGYPSLVRLEATYLPS